MKKINVRLAKPEECEEMLNWMAPNCDDFSKVGYPTTRLVLSENGTGPIQYALIHMVAILQTLGPNPKAKNGELALGLKGIIERVGADLKRIGVEEMIAFTGPMDAGLEHLAERHGWEKLEGFTTWRRKL